MNGPYDLSALRPDGPRISCGDRHWSNLDALVRDASSVKYHKDRTAQLEYMLGAIAKTHPELRIPKRAVDAHDRAFIGSDPMTNEYILYVKERQ